MCMNNEHEMTLVPMMDTDRNIELKCLFPNCDYKMRPGQKTYLEILEKQLHV